MLINHITSGSKGNAIIVDDGESKLLLDAGIRYKDVARWIRPTDLAGVLVTHEHQDHAKAVHELARRGLHVCLSRGTADELEVDKNSNARIIEHLQQFEAGSWIVVPFDVIHDSAEPMGFLFQSTATGEKGVYIVDSGLVGYNFSGVTHWLLECNYSERLLEDGPYEDYLKDRVRRNHFSLEDLKTFLGDSDLSETEEIYLLHLSSANADEELFKKYIQRLTGKPVYTISDNENKKSVLNY